MLETTYTIYSDDCGYISHYSNESYLFQDMQCLNTTFDDLSDVWNLWYKLTESKEFDYTELHIVQIDRHKIVL